MNGSCGCKLRSTNLEKLLVQKLIELTTGLTGFPYL